MELQISCEAFLTHEECYYCVVFGWKFGVKVEFDCWWYWTCTLELDGGNSLTCRTCYCSGVISSTQHSAAQFDLGMEILSDSDKTDDGEDAQSQAHMIPECDREDSPPPCRPTPVLVLYDDSQDVSLGHGKPSKTVPNERFKTLLMPVNQKRLTGKTFADSTDQKIAWAMSLYHDWKHLRIDSGELSDIFQTINSYLDEPRLDKINLHTALCAFVSNCEMRR